jgi:anion-transporting  ArsA/GET3 family ATPase
MRGWPRVVFVLGKGGVGRSTVATALATSLARGGERVLVFEWALTETIGPWFGQDPVGIEPREVAPGVSVANFTLDESLRAYFVDHLKMGMFYRTLVHAGPVRHLVEAAPGIAEMMFLGHICWLTTQAGDEAGLRFDRVVVDAPATGHGSSLLDLPTTLGAVHAAGLLGSELARVAEMMRDPTWTGALAVSLPAPLAVDETLELVPRATASLARPLLAVLINRSTSRFIADDPTPAWLKALRARGSPAAEALEAIHAELHARVGFEQHLRAALGGKTQHGLFALDERLASGLDASPSAIVAALSRTLDPWLAGP